MPIAPLVPPTQVSGYRESAPNQPSFEPGQVELAQPDNSSIDAQTGAKITVNDDGSVVIDMSPGKPKKEKSSAFDANLAEDLDESDLGVVAEEVLQGIDNDIRSRIEWETAYDKGIALMGLKLEEASSEVSQGGSVSKVYHPLLIEATVRYQSNAMAELLPSSGPVKVRDDAVKTDQARSDLADAFEKDFNHYLTTIAKEYYPDTDQLLFNQGWCGMAFKKVFECPIRKRPCSDLVLATDLIVSNDIVDLETAGRKTHRTYMSNGLIRRLQKANVYRKIDLGQPVEQPTIVEEKVAEVASVSLSEKLPTDHRHTIYECYVEMDLPGHEKDIPLPYRITIDKDSRQVLEIRRNWNEGDEDFKANCPFVKYGMIPALGFYDLGFVHLLGNTVRALTAILRMQLDAGQFSIFPGFLFSKQGARQTTNDIRLAPGTGKEIDTGGMPIQQVAMALPYPGPSQTLAAISEKTAEDGMRLGGASQVEVGEGRADVPVGTTMALIEQATKVMAAVHKRNHISQQREFEKLRELFNKNPKALTKFAKNPARKWQEAAEFADLELVPASDPNIPSHTHRLMQANALVMLAQASPQTFNVRNVAQRALSTIGIKDTENLLAPLPPPGAPPPPPPPEIQLKNRELDIKQQQMQLSAQQQATHDQARVQQMQMDTINSAKERESREKIEVMKTIADQKKHDSAIQKDQMQYAHTLISEHLKHDSGLMADHITNQRQLAADMTQHHTQLASDNAQHVSGLLADHAQHVSGLLADHHNHTLELESKERQAKSKAADKSIDVT